MLNNIKLYIIGALMIAICGIYISWQKEINKRRKAETELVIEVNNRKAAEHGVVTWRDAYNQSNAKSLSYLYSIEDLKKTSDSINQKLLEHVKRQDVQLRDVHSLLHAVSKTETTLEREINIPTMPDTTIDLSTKHIKNVLYLSPVKVSSEISIIDTLSGIFTERRETVQPPKKFFICRWFQKRHTIVEMQITRSNPLVETVDQKFIHIVK